MHAAVLPNAYSSQAAKPRNTRKIRNTLQGLENPPSTTLSRVFRGSFHQRATRGLSLRVSKRLKGVSDQLSDVVQREIRRRICCEDPGVMGVMALPDEHCGHALAPNTFDGGQNVQFVVDDYVMAGRKPGGDIREFLLFVNIDENPTFDRRVEACSFDFMRLKDDIAVAEHGGFAPLLNMLNCVQRFWKEPFYERIID